jgi:hypothetical protein
MMQQKEESDNEIIDNNVYDLFVIFFARKSLPYSLFEENSFIEAIKLYKMRPNIKFSKHKLKERIMYMGEKVCTDVINKLSLDKTPVTLAIDGWTNVRSNKVTNLLLISNSISYYYSNIENYNNQNNAEWFSSQLQIKIDDLIKKEINIITITTNNENLMKATYKKIKEKYPILIDIPYAAHLLQLCLKNICSISKIELIINNILNIVNTIKNNKENRIKLKELQKAAGFEK